MSKIKKNKDDNTVEGCQNDSSLLIRKTWFVYMHLSPSGKVYIGITGKKKPEMRWENGNGYKRNIYFKRAIDKYGWDNFEHIIMASGLTKDEALKMERDLIKIHKSTDPQYGYNHSPGGESYSIGHKWPKESVEKARENSSASKPVYQFDLEYNFIAEYISARAAARALNVSGDNSSSINLCCLLQTLSAYGYVWRHKEDVPDPYNKSCIPKPNCDNIRFKEVYQIDILTREYRIWPSIMYASEHTGISHRIIQLSCHDKTKWTTAGSIFRYCKDIDDIEEFVSNDSNFSNGNQKQIIQLSMDGDFIRSFNSLTEAATKTEANNTFESKRAYISRVCRGLLESFAGYRWQYATL